MLIQSLFFRLWGNVIFWVSSVDIEDKLVDILLPIQFQAEVSVCSHPVGKSSSVRVHVTGFSESKTSTSGHAPLSFGHVFLVVIVTSVGSEEVSGVLSRVVEDTEEKTASKSTESVDDFDIIVVSTGSDNSFDHSGSVGGVTGLSVEGGPQGIRCDGGEHSLVSPLCFSVSST